MLKAVNLAKIVKWEHPLDPDYGTENSTKFLIGALDARILSHIKDKATSIPVSAFGSGDGMASLNMNQMNFDAVIFGLKGMENYDQTYITSKRVVGQHSYTVADPDFVAGFEEEWIADIADAILTINTVSETDAKN